MKNIYITTIMCGLVLLSGCSSRQISNTQNVDFGGKKRAIDITRMVDSGNATPKEAVEYIKSQPYELYYHRIIASNALYNGVCDLTYEMILQGMVSFDVHGNDTGMNIFDCIAGRTKKYGMILSEILDKNIPISTANENLEYFYDKLWGRLIADHDIFLIQKLLEKGYSPPPLRIRLALTRSSFEESFALFNLFLPHISPSVLNEKIKHIDQSVLSNVIRKQYTLENKHIYIKKLLVKGADVNRVYSFTDYHGNRVETTPYTEGIEQGLLSKTIALLKSHGADEEYYVRFKKVTEKRKAKDYLQKLVPGTNTSIGLVIEVRSNLVLLQQKDSTRWVSGIDVWKANRGK